MLYRVLHENQADNGIVVLSIKPSILNLKGAFITTGNAASQFTDILPATKYKEVNSKILEGTDVEWWKEEDGSKRRIMAECLVPNSVPPDFIQTIYVPSQKAANKVLEVVSNSTYGNLPQPPVSIEPSMFFLPANRTVLTSNISIIEGDMFFSRMQTLTISVNCVGVMGKGLASTAKYRLADMYVYYQDLCRNGILKMGKPQLYKRESSIFTELAEDVTNLEEFSQETGFLLFPTKHHWKNNSDLKGIEQGLQWLQENYQKEGIISLAMPALGCGLGNLDWRDVDPIMCTDKKISQELLSQEFLLSQT